MGQYQQWLHYLEIERRLQATLNALEEELCQAESSLDHSQQMNMPPDNPIISALAACLAVGQNGHASPQENPNATYNGFAEESGRHMPDDSSETISAALLHWGELPDFGPQTLHPSQQHDIQPFLSFDYPEVELLPDDMFAFFEEHSQTDPQLELPWWLRKINITKGDDESGKPIDQESIRTNRLVQRWVERWGRQPQGNFPPGSEDASNGK